MNTTPTAINFLESRGYFDSEDYEDLLIEFAKLHVEAALKNQTKILWIPMWEISLRNKRIWRKILNNINAIINIQDSLLVWLIGIFKVYLQLWANYMKSFVSNKFHQYKINFTNEF